MLGASSRGGHAAASAERKEVDTTRGRPTRRRRRRRHQRKEASLAAAATIFSPRRRPVAQSTQLGRGKQENGPGGRRRRRGELRGGNDLGRGGARAKADWFFPLPPSRSSSQHVDPPSTTTAAAATTTSGLVPFRRNTTGQGERDFLSYTLDFLLPLLFFFRPSPLIRAAETRSRVCALPQNAVARARSGHVHSFLSRTNCYQSCEKI